MKAYKTNILLPLSLLIFFNLSQLIAQDNCNEDTSTITITLPAINSGITEVGLHPVPDIWWNEVEPVADTIYIPNGRPIYALIVSGYASNQHLDEMMLYNFARNIMEKGGYVHYAWWNNLLAPYMERPLHNLQSEPGNLELDHLLSFTSAFAARKKALPGEDYQFVKDAKKFLRKIRTHNPDALIIVAGHSMGGGAVVHLADELSKEENPIQIDILAPIDPVGNRNIPWAGVGRQGVEGFPNTVEKDYNFTRWRVSRDGFRGYKKSKNTGTILNPNCTPTGSWLSSPPLIGSSDLLCSAIMFVDNPPAITFGSNIVNLYHRYQMEAKFPYDYNKIYGFGRDAPIGAIDMQWRVPMKREGENDNGGWLKDGLPQNGQDEFCCRSGEGAEGWNKDGHGEIVGYRGPVFEGNPSNGFPVPLAVRLKTSPQCGKDCDNLIWPSRTHKIIGGWVNGNSERRKLYLQNLESLPLTTSWHHRPKSPNMCLVSKRHRGRDGLIELLRDILPDPPIANAGEDQVVECTGLDGALVTLDGSSSAPEDGNLCYTWYGIFGTVTGVSVSVSLPLGSHTITLTVTDQYGQTDSDDVIIEIVDTTPPELTVSLNPNLLWPPNHKMVNISATVDAEDLCGSVNTILYSIVASEADNVIGSGNTSPDIAGATFNTEDVFFKLRAERSGRNRSRVYTVTYKATDDSNNETFTSAEVVVENPSNNFNISNLQGRTRNYPNPFNSSTKITYFLPENDHVKITVYNLLGRELKVLMDGVQKAGAKSITFDGSEFVSGIYFYRITSNKNKVMINKMVIKK